MLETIVAKDVFPIIKKAVTDLYEFVSPTFGPSENKIVLGKPNLTMVLDDGVMAAREFESADPLENEILKIVKEVAIRTNNRVGDGTTGSLIMAYALISEIADFGKVDGKKIKTELKKAFEEFKEKITKKAKKIKSKEELEKVARVSFDNPEIAKMIADLLFKVGHDGVVAIEESPSGETTIEMTEGLELASGYASPYFINNPERMETVLNKPYVLVTSYRLTAPQDLVAVMEKIIGANGRELLIVAESSEGDALATLVVNKVNGKFNSLAVDCPRFGVDKLETLNDIALMTGATVISEQNGLKTSDITLEHLGRADKVISKADKTTIIGGKGKASEIKKVIQFLKGRINAGEDFYKKRLAKLQNGVAIIKVGAPTENELHALKYKVEDAVNATKVAYASGVVRGAGIALAEIETSSEILNKALKYPHKQLLENTGWELKDIDSNVVDPVEVLIAGVESAVSIASLLASTKRICVKREKEKDGTHP